MTMLDIYLDLMLYVRHCFSETEAASKSEHDQDEIRGRLQSCDNKARKLGAPKSTIATARLATVAYIDEVALSRQWAGQVQWSRNPIQKSDLGTTNLGAEFYEELSRLGKQKWDLEVQKIYLAALSLGFRGKYFSNDDESKRNEIRQAILTDLMPEATGIPLEKLRLLGGDESGTKVSKSRIARRPRMIPLLVIIPGAIILSTFWLFHYLVLNLVKELAERIH